MPGERLHILLHAGSHRLEYPAFELNNLSVLVRVNRLPVALQNLILCYGFDRVQHRRMIVRNSVTVARHHSDGCQAAPRRLQTFVCQILCQLPGENNACIPATIANVGGFQAVKIGHNVNDVFYAGAVYARL